MSIVSKSRHALVVFLILVSAVAAGCNSSATGSSSASAPEKKESAPPPPPEAPKPRVTDPTTTGESDSEALRKAWQRLTANGQYRLAQMEDMRFSEAAIRTNEIDHIYYVYIRGDLAYEKRVEDDHLAAIVVDTTRTDANRFGLVIFSPPEGSRDYKLHWLYRARDLSRTTVGRASGSFFVSEYLEDGSRQTCAVHWYRSRKQFECKRAGATS
ncbi:MAG TPA: hypothetical protein VF656_03205 [Pyrinomonadaceae bacterium]|jgi:hypothetical protein